MIQKRATLCLLTSLFILQACSNENPCPQFENREELEATIIPIAKERMLDYLIRHGKIEEPGDIVFFDDCCSVYKIDERILGIPNPSQDVNYGVGISHHKRKEKNRIIYFSATYNFGCSNIEHSIVEAREKNRIIQKKCSKNLVEKLTFRNLKLRVKHDQNKRSCSTGDWLMCA